MKDKILIICNALLWCFVILLFPIASGTISVIFSMNIIETLFLQGVFMAMALIVPIVLVLCGKWRWREIGFAKTNLKECKKVLYFIPLLVIFVPVAIKGFIVRSISYVLGSLFLYLFVGISEEVYFRGIIPRYLEKEFSTSGVVIGSSVIFAIGHMATAFTGSSGLEVVLTVFNAFIFGWLAIEMTILSSNIIPVVVVHFLFDFETKIVKMNGSELLLAEGIRGFFMFIIATWLAVIIYRQKTEEA